MSPELENFWLEAKWPAPPGVRAGITSRQGGCSDRPFDTFNLALHVGDAEDAVLTNRRELLRRLGLDSEPAWLNQRHGATVLDLVPGQAGLQADGCHTARPRQACVVLTADCIPLLITDRAGTEVAAVHIGWRGLSAGIARNAVDRFRQSPGQLLAWIGPHIGAANYIVRDDVRDACLRAAPQATSGFTVAGPSLWHADLARVLKCQLRACGVESVFGDGRCTFQAADLFYSYRRDGQTGRMASLIWIR